MNADRHQVSLQRNATANGRLEQSFERSNLSPWPGNLLEQIRRAFRPAYIIYGGLCPEGRQSTEDEHPLARLYSRKDCNYRVIFGQRVLLGPGIESRFARLRMMIDEPGEAGARDQREIRCGLKYTQGRIFCCGANKDQVLGLRFVPGHQQTSLQDEMRLVSVEQGGQRIDRRELSNTRIGFHIVVGP